MKKLLLLISSLAMIGPVATSVVACGNKGGTKIEKTEPTKDLKTIIKVTRLEFDNKVDPLNKDKLKAKIQSKNKNLDVNYINVVLKDNDINTHKAIVTPNIPEGKNGSIYTGQVEIDIITPLADDIKVTNLGKFTGKEDQPSIAELNKQVLEKNASFGYDKDKVEILNITTESATIKAKTAGFYTGEVEVTYEYSKKKSETDLSNVLKDSGLKLALKEPSEADIKKQIEIQNEGINIDAVKIENIDIKTHSATAVGDGIIYTGSVNLILKYDIKLDVTETNLQVYGESETPTDFEVNQIIKRYNSDYASDQVEFIAKPTREKAIIKGKDKGFYYGQIEVNYKYISIPEILDVINQAEIKIELKLGDVQYTYLERVRDFLKEEFKKKKEINVPSNFGLHAGWNKEWTSKDDHKVGDVFKITTWLRIMTGFDKPLPFIDSIEIEITIVE